MPLADSFGDQEVKPMPLAASFIDLDPAKDKLYKGVFKGPWYTVLANIYGVPRSDIEQRDRTRKKRQRRVTTALVAGIIAVLAGALILALIQRQRAEKAQAKAVRQAELSRRATYNVQLARVRDLWRRDPAQALDLLNDKSRAPLDLRDFTWGFMYRLSKKLRMSLVGHTEAVSSVAFSSDGKTLASASWDETIKLWDAQTGQERATLTGHTDKVVSVAFSPGGKTLASASRDKTIKLWDAATGHERATLTGHAAVVISVAFSANGKTLASASADSTIKLW